MKLNEVLNLLLEVKMEKYNAWLEKAEAAMKKGNLQEFANLMQSIAPDPNKLPPIDKDYESNDIANMKHYIGDPMNPDAKGSLIKYIEDKKQELEKMKPKFTTPGVNNAYDAITNSINNLKKIISSYEEKEVKAGEVTKRNLWKKRPGENPAPGTSPA